MRVVSLSRAVQITSDLRALNWGQSVSSLAASSDGRGIAADQTAEREADQKPTYDAATSKRVPTEEEQQIKTDLHYAFTDNCRRPAPDMESSAQ